MSSATYTLIAKTNCFGSSIGTNSAVNNELSESGTFNKANEWTGRARTVPGSASDKLSYDAVGNLVNNNDGGVDGDDQAAFATIWAIGESPKGGLCMTTSIRIGYAGYQWDGSINISDSTRNYSGAMAGLYHVRNRAYDPELGRWTRRDPIGYVDGLGLYEYVRASPIVSIDGSGLFATRCNRAGCGGSQTGSPTPGLGITLPYPQVPCGTPQRDATCGRWAAQACSNRGAVQSKCYDACVSAATACCTGTGCDLTDNGASCTADGVLAAARCNNPGLEKECFADCVKNTLQPGGNCHQPCRLCDVVWSDPLGSAIFCAGSCAFLRLPGVPEWAQAPYKTCVKSCFLGLGFWTAGPCATCVGCVYSQTLVCYQECY